MRIEIYQRRQGASQVMLASGTVNVESARDVVPRGFAQARRDPDELRGRREAVGPKERRQKCASES
jgi:hypothetical protein